MSTAGKVLVVVVLIVVPVWILLASAVSQLNTEWSQALKTQREEVEKLEQDVVKNEREIQSLKDRIGLEQDSLNDHNTALRTQLTEVERTKAETITIQAAIKVQLQVLTAAIKNAESVRDERNAEKQAETEGKANAEKDVTTLAARNAELLDQLTQLRNEFKATLDANRATVDRILRSRTQRVTRPAVFVR